MTMLKTENGEVVEMTPEEIAWQMEHYAAQAALELATVPKSVTNYQARMALHAAGLYREVDAMIDALGPLSVEYSAWWTAPAFRRDSQLMATLGEQLGLSEPQIDDLFRAARTLT